MMSKKQWFLLLCLFIVYLLIGASIFYYIESAEETKMIHKAVEEKKIIESLLKKYFVGNKDKQKDLFNRLTNYCGKPLGTEMSQENDAYKWNFYYSLFFVITVVSTIGYGNLAPTTSFTRIFMIFYALIGIPMNGILMVTLGEYFGKSFKKLHQRWKNSKIDYDTAKLGLIGQIILYLVPGFTFFIFLPSTIMTVFEGWSYEVSVYYCFVSLTTIGFGDYVAGVNDVASFGVWYNVYQIFLLVWVIGGIGYIVMVLNFITQGMRHKKIVQIEHIISENIRSTPKKIRHELRSILQEFLFLRVKPVYKGEFEYTPHIIDRSQSCPDLSSYRCPDSPSAVRKRAMSECYRHVVLQRIQSDTDLDRIDKERTFRPSDAFMQQKDLLLKVVDALSVRSPDLESGETGVHLFSDAEILASEGFYNSGDKLRSQRRRAVSDIRPPSTYSTLKYNNDNTWYGADAAKALEAFKNRSMSIPENVRRERTTLYQRIKNRFRVKDDSGLDVEKNEDLSEQKRKPSIFIDPDATRRTSIASAFHEKVLEETSIADFIRALSAITVPETLQPNTKKSPSPPRTRRPAISSNLQSRRTSLMPSPTLHVSRHRRFSLRPADENLLHSPGLKSRKLSTKPSAGNTVPATIEEASGGALAGGRRISLRPDTNTFQSTTAPSVATQEERRISLRPDQMERRKSSRPTDDAVPPPYSLYPLEARNTAQLRKFSVRPTNLATLNVTGPCQRQVNKRERTDTEGSDR